MHRKPLAALEAALVEAALEAALEVELEVAGADSVEAVVIRVNLNSIIYPNPNSCR